MNKLNFRIEPSKTQYDLYKYKIGNVVSYGKRKVYRYAVNGVYYNIKTEQFFKYLYEVLVPKPEWDKFKNESWEEVLYELNLYEDIIDHVRGICQQNSFKSISLPEEIDFEPEVNPNAGLELIVSWFRDPVFKPNSNQVYYVIFHR